jgi:RNA polymerase sigma-B factor
VLSSRRDLSEQSPQPGASPGRKRALQPLAPPSRRGKIRTPLTNQDALAALKRADDPLERQVLRSELVRRNLPLVYAVIARLGRTQVLPQEDLRQIGALGLLRAIDAYEPSQGRTLSSFAVPYIRGAIQHELRDRASLMRIPRPLWELRRRATVLQDRRRRLGQPQLAPAQLAEALDCPTSQVVEALQVGAVVDMRSLDAPGFGEGGDEATARTLLDQLPDPASLRDAAAEAPAAGSIDALLAAGANPGHSGGSDPGATAAAANEEPAAAIPAADLREKAAEPCLPTGWPLSPELSWLQQRLLGLSALERWLVVGHVCAGRSWVELGREVGLHPRRVQRRTVALLTRLQAEGQRWRNDSGAAATSA